VSGAASHTSGLAVDDLSVRFGSFIAVAGVTLRVAPRGIHAIIGPNGAGKTTLFNAISGFAPPARGRVRLDGADITGQRADRLARLGLARSFQICAVFPELSVAQNLQMAMLRHAGPAALLRRADATLTAQAEELLDGVKLLAARHRRAADLSYGQRRLLEIVTTLLLAPKLLLLDEPIAGLAREDIPPVIELIRRASTRCGVLLIEHNLPVVETLAGTVTVLGAGKVLCEGTYAQVAADPRVREAYIGTLDA
jgi:branched-chain amino acid transport system ATP-binding protein